MRTLIVIGIATFTFATAASSGFAQTNSRGALVGVETQAFAPCILDDGYGRRGSCDRGGE